MTSDFPTPSDRAARGKAARSRSTRAGQAELTIGGDRPDPVALLEQQAASRVPELVPIRYGRMLVSPFTFYRGAALLMATDLARNPTTGFTVQACGDAHLLNFGLFATPERNLVFDLNDFDETHPGPWEWDVKRLAASMVVAARDRSFTDKERRAIVLATVESYRTSMRKFAAMGHREVWYAHFDVDRNMGMLDTELAKAGRTQTRTVVEKARTKDSTRALSKLTRVVDGQLRIISDPPLIVPVEELDTGLDPGTLTDSMRGLLRSYRRTLPTDRRQLLDGYQFLHIARKVVGVGSVGTRAWILLLMGRDHQDPLFLQAKEAQASVLEPFTRRHQHASEGARVVAGERLMQATSDIFLGWDRVVGFDGVRRDFYVRQLQDWKGSVDPSRAVPAGLTAYGRLCGWTLARAHARSGDRVAIASYLGSGKVFDEAIATFSELYADQNERDYEALQQAVATGRITAQTGI